LIVEDPEPGQDAITDERDWDAPKCGPVSAQAISCRIFTALVTVQWRDVDGPGRARAEHSRDLADPNRNSHQHTRL